MPRKVLYKSEAGHEVKIAKVETTSNGELVVHLHCCDNPSTEHRVTLQQVHKFSPVEIEAKLVENNAVFVAEQHAAMDAARAHLQSLIGDEPILEHQTSMKLLG